MTIISFLPGNRADLCLGDVAMKYFMTIMIGLISFNSLKCQTLAIGPHGGSLNSTREYNVEFYSCSEYYEIYVYDKALSPVLNSGIKGNVVFHFNNKGDLKLELTHYGVDGFTVKGPDEAFQSCTVQLNINGRPLSASFSNDGKCLPN